MNHKYSLTLPSYNRSNILRDFDSFEGLLSEVLWPRSSRSELDYDEKEGVYSTSLNLAGFKKDEVKIEVSDSHVVVTAESPKRGKFSQSIYASDVDTERIEARLEDGILSLQLPKLVEAMPRRIEIK